LANAKEGALGYYYLIVFSIYLGGGKGIPASDSLSSESSISFPSLSKSLSSSNSKSILGN
jgi:hypothetical protein